MRTCPAGQAVVADWHRVSLMTPLGPGARLLQHAGVRKYSIGTPDADRTSKAATLWISPSEYEYR